MRPSCKGSDQVAQPTNMVHFHGASFFSKVRNRRLSICTHKISENFMGACEIREKTINAGQLFATMHALCMVV